MFFFHVIKVDASLFSGCIVDYLSDQPCFLMHVRLVDTYMVIVMSFIPTVVTMSPLSMGFVPLQTVTPYGLSQIIVS